MRGQRASKWLGWDLSPAWLIPKPKLLNTSLYFCQSPTGFIILTWWPWMSMTQVSCCGKQGCHSSRPKTTFMPRLCLPLTAPRQSQAQLMGSSLGSFGWKLSISLADSFLELCWVSDSSYPILHPPPSPFPQSHCLLLLSPLCPSQSIPQRISCTPNPTLAFTPWRSQPNIILGTIRSQPA